MKVKVSIPQAVWGHMWRQNVFPHRRISRNVSIPQAVWGHMWLTCKGLDVHPHCLFQYRKRYEVTCDSVSGRPQKQKAQIMVLENLLESEHVLALFRLSSHTYRVCDGPAKPYIARLAAIRGKLENPPRFFASRRFSIFYTLAWFFTFVKHI